MSESDGRGEPQQRAAVAPAPGGRRDRGKDGREKKGNKRGEEKKVTVSRRRMLRQLTRPLEVVGSEWSPVVPVALAALPCSGGRRGVSTRCAAAPASARRAPAPRERRGRSEVGGTIADGAPGRRQELRVARIPPGLVLFSSQLCGRAPPVPAVASLSALAPPLAALALVEEILWGCAGERCGVVCVWRNLIRWTTRWANNEAKTRGRAPPLSLSAYSPLPKEKKRERERASIATEDCQAVARQLLLRR